jgi:hypothetical protein
VPPGVTPEVTQPVVKISARAAVDTANRDENSMA